MWDNIYSFFQEKVKTKKFSFIVCFIILLIIWFFPTKISYDINVFFIPLDLLIRIVLSVIIILFVLIDYFAIKKNKTKKCGLGIYISSSVIEKKDLRKNLLLSTLKQRLKNDYELIIYNKEDLERLTKKNPLESIMNKLNLTILFEVTERTGKKNSTNVYELKFYKSIISNQLFDELETPNYIQTNLINSLNSCIQITNENSINDVDNEITLFEIGIDYIVSILLSFSNKPEKAFELLDKTSAVINVTKLDKKNIYFIKNNIKYVYMKTYLNCAQSIFNFEEYYKDSSSLNKLKHYLLQYKSILDKNKKEIPAKKYNSLLSGYYIPMSIVFYEEGNIKDGLECIYRSDLTLTYNSGILFNKAFLLANDKQYYKSYQTYKKTSLKKYTNEQINKIIDFIEKRNELNEDNKDVKFCLAMVNYYYKDKVLAEKYLKELSSLNKEIKEIYEELFF